MGLNAMSDARQMLKITGLNWERPVDVHIGWFEADRETLMTILDRLYPDCDISKLAFLYQHYDYLENQIFAFLDDDGESEVKAAWILRQHFEKIVGGIPDELGDDLLDSTIITRTYDLPEFGKTDEWLDYVDAMYEMFVHGPTDKTMVAIARMRRLRQEFLDNRTN